MAFISVHWKAKDENYWDLHSNVFGMGEIQLPQLDQLTFVLLLDLEERGLLDPMLIVITGAMGPMPTKNKDARRDHWPQCGL